MSFYVIVNGHILNAMLIPEEIHVMYAYCIYVCMDTFCWYVNEYAENTEVTNRQ